MIGATTSQILDLTLLNKGDIVYGTSTIKVEIGLKIGSTIEYIPLGIYNIDDIEKTDYTVKITAYDNMIKFERNFTTSLGDTLTLQQVVSELTRITGVQFTGSLPSYTVKKLEGFTCREMLSYVASLCGGNAVITRDGKFTIVTPTDVNYSIGTANYFDYKREETKYKIGKIFCQVGDEVLSKGSIGSDSMELQFENPWVSKTILNDIYTTLNGFEYLGYSMKWQGDLSLDVGDIVTITDKKGVVRKHPILSQKFIYTGGLTSEISGKGETKNKNSFDSSGSMKKKIDRVVTELAIVNEALVDVAYIGDLTAGNIKFDTASGGILDLQTLLSKFVTGENGQFLNLTTDNVLIDNAIIKDAMIESVNASKINSGVINSNLVEIKGSNGNLVIKDNTIQIKDSNRVRVQIGKDYNNDYNMYVWDSNGRLMFDATGLKADGIKSKIIRDDMVSDTANISGSKLNISSVISAINNDNTTTLKSSKILLNDEGQSLEVAFNSLKSNVDGFDGRIKANTTSLTVAQGKIEGLIKESEITKGDVTTLKDNYTSVKATVDGINTTVASHTSSIGSLNTNVSTMQGSITQLNNKIALKVEATDITNAINNVQIGGRNFILGGKGNHKEGFFTGFDKVENGYGELTLTSSAEYKVISIRPGMVNAISDWEVGREVTWSYDFMYTSWNMPTGTDIREFWLGDRYGAPSYTGMTKHNFPRVNGKNSDGQVIELNKWYRFTFTTIIPARPADISSNVASFQFYNSNSAVSASFTVRMKNVKLEYGNKATDWTPAPEDVDQAISTVDTKITTTNNKVATIETNVNSITSRVASTESVNTTNSNNISNLLTRMNSAETKLTATSLTTTISSGLAGSNSISNTKFTMNKDGLTIKNGGLKIQNNAGADVLVANTSGNLWLKESLEVGGSANGKLSVLDSSNNVIVGLDRINGLAIKDNKFTITSGAITPGAGITYPQGNKYTLVGNSSGFNINYEGQSGSQEYLGSASYKLNGLSIVTDNRNNGNQNYYSNEQTSSKITLTEIKGTTTKKSELSLTDVIVAGNSVVSSGTNANGTWVRYYDGTQICRGNWPIGNNITFNTLSGGVYTNTTYSNKQYTFPVSFVDIPTVSITGHSNGYLSSSVGTVTATGFLGRIYAHTNINMNTVQLHYVAIGRWK